MVSLIGIFLVVQAIPALTNNSENFFTSRVWEPGGEQPAFGIVEFLWTTVLSSLVAMVLGGIAVILGTAPGIAQQPGPARKPAAVPGAPAATPSGKSEAKEPIEIQADRLEVDQEKQIAVFSGQVDAVQGDMTLRADRLRVFYTDADARPANTGNQAQDQSIRRIEAEGSVLLTQPGETAEGDAGVYDV